MAGKVVRETCSMCANWEDTFACDGDADDWRLCIIADKKKWDDSTICEFHYRPITVRKEARDGD